MPIAKSLLRDGDPEVRIAAIGALATLLSKDAVPDLIAALTDERETVRAAAKSALETIRFYFEEKQRWDDWQSGRGENPAEGRRKLLDALDDSSEAVRVAAIDSLGTLKATDALPRLLEILKSGRTSADREAAGRAIARINQASEGPASRTGVR
ncbi:MAG TPA: HEAT repeat domain-containing protein [Planctomycetota bacterium]|nr:HEAT repeat domain-containing protein [Planctomycetota bacterium]